MEELKKKFGEKICDYFFDNLPTILSLFIGELLVIGLTKMTSGFIADLFGIEANKSLRLVALTLSMAWIGLWLWIRKMPKGDKKKIVIVIAIQAFKDKQKISLIDDFKEKIEDLLVKESLGNIIELVVLNEYHSTLVVPKFRKYAATGDKKERDKLVKKTNGRFFIYGGVKDRDAGAKKCFLDIDALILYEPNNKAKEHIEDGFANLWFRKTCFEKNREFQGFQFTAERTFDATRYVVGVAALASGNAEIALRLHSSLYKDITQFKKQFKPCPPNILRIENKLKPLLIEENLVLSYHHYSSGDFKDSEKYLDQSMQIEKNYAGYLMQSTLEFSYKNNPKKALESVRNAKDLANGDGTWRYNKAFLLMYSEKLSEALKTYKQIFKPQNFYPGEEITLSQVYDFNEKFILNNPDKTWSHFILGYLKYKRAGNGAEADGHFENFLKSSEGKNRYPELISEAKVCVEKIKNSGWGASGVNAETSY